ncbi:MAG: metal-sulfur cluster assembly factor [Bacteroidetes bacterium]|nr:metal-sulfur cluster assembly factor [Bacteroidota bacterium]MBU1484891.1 metal-sulfur cluster assembly factor [Bacteroidota bacterium]MBU2046771.1 metal-sulfur cluster assembly factor [Bacteroidota bacterium]MBU2266509.1 metal-sulfur cluster assembly factor [Bacteroidota bacterium]MBU2374956.1 metal-sulfur cluster assembly factor [Bacteroidota bacterium]
MKVLNALSTVLDPELQVNIIDLGLVYDIIVLENSKKIEINMTLSSTHCPMGAAIVNSVENCISHHFTAYQAIVNLVWEPVWSFEQITEEGKLQLEM